MRTVLRLALALSIAAAGAHAQPPARNGMVVIPGVEQGEWSYAGGSPASQIFLRRAPAPTPGLAGVEIRIEQVQAGAGIDGLSARSLSEVDCARSRARELSVDLHAGHNLTGEKVTRPVATDWKPLAANRMGWVMQAMVCPTSQVVKAPRLIPGVTQGDWTWLGDQADGGQVFIRRIATAPGAFRQADIRIEFANDAPRNPGGSLSLVTEADCARGRSRILRSLLYARHNQQGESMATPGEPAWQDEDPRSDVQAFVFTCLTLVTDPGAAAAVAAPAPPANALLQGWAPLEETSAVRYLWRREPTAAGAEATVSVRSEFGAAQGEGAAKYLSLLITFDLRCREGTARRTHTGLWQDRNLSGPGGIRPTPEDWSPIPADSLKSQLAGLACR